MTEVTRNDQQLTLGDLCQAIEDGRVDYTVREGCYQVKRTAARRLQLDVDSAILDILAGAAHDNSGIEYSA